MGWVQGTLAAQGDQSGQDRGAGGHGEPEAATILYLESFNILANGSHHPMSLGDPQHGSNGSLDVDPARVFHRSRICRAVWLPVLIDTRLRRQEEGGRPSSRVIHLASLSGLSFLICEVGATRALAALDPWAEKTALVQHLPFLPPVHPPGPACRKLHRGLADSD